jgi:hypothetical protein
MSKGANVELLGRENAHVQKTVPGGESPQPYENDLQIVSRSDVSDSIRSALSLS